MERNYDRESSVSTKLTYLLVGGGIGAVLALLFAPKSGHELREDIADATRKGLEKGRDAASQIQERAGEYYEASRERAGDLYQSTTDRAAEIGERVKGAAATAANPFTAAIEAGREAYNAERRRNESKSITEGRASYPVEEIAPATSTETSIGEPGDDKT
jgi:gas vesicle protein